MWFALVCLDAQKIKKKERGQDKTSIYYNLGFIIKQAEKVKRNKSFSLLNLH